MISESDLYLLTKQWLAKNMFLSSEYLWKMFYPANYQNTEVDKLPEPGQLRQYKTFDFKLAMQNELTIDILFTKHKVRLYHTWLCHCFHQNIVDEF